MAVQDPSNTVTVPDETPVDTVPDYATSGTLADYTPATGFQSRRPNSRVTAAPPETELSTSERSQELEADLRTNKVTAERQASIQRLPPEASSAIARNKITAERPASIQGFVKDEGEPIKDADVRIESRDGKQVFSTVKTDPKGRYVSEGLEPGVYRVTLLLNGAVKASIMNTQTKASKPTELNFDLKRMSQAGTTAKGGKHMVWVPSRTGSHIGGNWVEVDDGGKAHSGSNIQTVTARNW
jgi:hypothetical protein